MGTLQRKNLYEVFKSRTRTSGGEFRKGARTIGVIGLGYVGLPLALLSEERGHRVVGVDIDKRKIAEINSRVTSPSLSLKENDLLKKSKIEVESSGESLKGADVIIVCVPTPVDEKHVPDLRPLESASETIGRHIKKGTLVVIESTVNPGVCEEIVLPKIEFLSGLKSEEDFFFAHCPERINPGDQKWTTANIPRVIGAKSKESLRRATSFYRSILDGDVFPMHSIKEAEAVKMVENSFRDVNIAFVNELAMSFHKLGIDVMNVIEGASTKPFAFMPHTPGCGVGGHCIPVDPYYLISYGKQNGFHHRLLSTARGVNNSMPSFTVDLLAETLLEKSKTLMGSHIALLGLSYKSGVGDLRESPALIIRKLLSEAGATVATYDPYVKNLSTAKSLKGALRGADAVVIATAHKEFSTISPSDFIKQKISIVIDGRNCLPKKEYLRAGIRYQGIGK